MDLDDLSTELLLARGETFLGGAKFSPDGGAFVYMAEDAGDRNIFEYSLTTGRSHRLSGHSDFEDDPVYSPDGESIVLARFLDGGTWDDMHGTALERVDLMTGDRDVLLESSGRMYGMAWSADGAALAFNSDEDGDHEIFVFYLESGELKQLTFNDVLDHQPIWHPNGQLLFTSYRNGPKELFWMDPESRMTIRISVD